MKKLIAVLICSAMVLSLAGCGSEAPQTTAPATEAPTTKAPSTEAPATAAPTTEAPTTEAPTTAAPTTEAPTTEAPTTAEPTTEAPTTEAPTTAEPATEAPAPSGSSEAGNVRVIGGRLRFTVPDDWEPEGNGYFGAGGRVYINFFSVPKTAGGFQLEADSLEDEDFCVKFADYLDKTSFYGDGYSIVLYQSSAAYAMDKFMHKTASGLRFREMLLNVKDKQSGSLATNVVGDVFEWDDDTYLLMIYQYGLIGSANALDCYSAVHDTLEPVE